MADAEHYEICCTVCFEKYVGAKDKGVITCNHVVCPKCYTEVKAAIQLQCSECEKFRDAWEPEGEGTGAGYVPPPPEIFRWCLDCNRQATGHCESHLITTVIGKDLDFTEVEQRYLSYRNNNASRMLVGEIQNDLDAWECTAKALLGTLRAELLLLQVVNSSALSVILQESSSPADIRKTQPGITSFEKEIAEKAAIIQTEIDKFTTAASTAAQNLHAGVKNLMQTFSSQRTTAE